MKPEVLSAIADYKGMCENPWKHTPLEVGEFISKWDLDSYIHLKEWVLIESISPYTEYWKHPQTGRWYVIGGLYKVTDQIRDVEFFLDMDNGLMIAEKGSCRLDKYVVTNNAFLVDYFNQPHILLSKKGGLI